MGILHITTAAEWERAREAGGYLAPSLETAGFIHCSRPDQVLRVADFLFRGREDLILLEIDPERLTAEVRYENCEGGVLLFPHVYGPIDVGAVIGVLDFPPGADGRFRLPQGLR